MLKPSLLFMILSMGMALLCNASQVVDNLKAGKDQTVVVYGTSLTAEGEWTRGLKTWLEALNPAARVTLVNSGQSGKTSDTGVQRLEELVLEKKPDTVFVEFAVNDAFEFPDKVRVVTLQRARQNLENMIDRILVAQPRAEIILQTMNPAWDAPNGRRLGSQRPLISEYYEVYRKVAAERCLLLIDHYARWKEIRLDDEGFFRRCVPDGEHPTKDASLEVTLPEIVKALSK